MHGGGNKHRGNKAAAYTVLRIARGREQLSKSFIDAALTVHGRLLALPRAEKLLLDMGNLPNTQSHSTRCTACRPSFPSAATR